MAQFKTKIGFNRGRRRIWIDGKRLVEAGFVGGSHYVLTQEDGALTLRRRRLDSVDGQVRKVTGRPDGKPIIDITGKTVSQTFADHVTHVNVTTDTGIIVITPDV